MSEKLKCVRFEEQRLTDSLDTNDRHYSPNDKSSRINNPTLSDLQNNVLHIIQQDDDIEFMKILSANTEIYQHDFFKDYSIIHYASKFNAQKIMEHILISNIFDVDMVSSDFEKTTPLFLAICEEHCEMILLLLNSGASEYEINTYMDTAVFAAVYYQKINALKVLVRQGCCRDMPATRKLHKKKRSQCFAESPLSCAIRKNSVECVSIILEGGADILETTLCNSLSVAAALSRSLESVAVLIEYMHTKLDYLAINTLLVTTLNESARLLNNKTAEYLLQYIPNSDDLTTTFRTSIQHNNISLVKAILKKGMQTTFADLQNAAAKCYADMLTCLIDHCAIGTYGKRHLVQSLVVRMAQMPTLMIMPVWVQYRNSYYTENERMGRKLIITGNHRRYLVVLQILIDNNAMVDVEPAVCDDDTDVPALHTMLQAGYICISLYLLMAGANPSRCNAQGWTSFYCIFKLLLRLSYMHPWRKENLCKLLVGLDFIMLIPQKEIKEISFMCDDESNLLMYEALPSCVKDIIRQNSGKPKSLMHACRMCIVQHLSPNSHRKIVKLKLPCIIQEYLRFKDLEDLLRFISGRYFESKNRLQQKDEGVDVLQDDDENNLCICMT